MYKDLRIELSGLYGKLDTLLLSLYYELLAKHFRELRICTYVLKVMTYSTMVDFKKGCIFSHITYILKAISMILFQIWSHFYGI